MYLGIIATVTGSFPPLTHDQLMTIASALFLAALGVQFVLLAKGRTKKRQSASQLKR
jgi:cytochrome c biogenesis protein CcdA